MIIIINNLASINIPSVNYIKEMLYADYLTLCNVIYIFILHYTAIAGTEFECEWHLIFSRYMYGNLVGKCMV